MRSMMRDHDGGPLMRFAQPVALIVTRSRGPRGTAIGWRVKASAHIGHDALVEENGVQRV